MNSSIGKEISVKRQIGAEQLVTVFRDKNVLLHMRTADFGMIEHRDTRLEPP